MLRQVIESRHQAMTGGGNQSQVALYLPRFYGITGPNPICLFFFYYYYLLFFLLLLLFVYLFS